METPRNPDEDVTVMYILCALVVIFIVELIWYARLRYKQKATRDEQDRAQKETERALRLASKKSKALLAPKLRGTEVEEIEDEDRKDRSDDESVIIDFNRFEDEAKLAGKQPRKKSSKTRKKDSGTASEPGRTGTGEALIRWLRQFDRKDEKRSNERIQKETTRRSLEKVKRLRVQELQERLTGPKERAQPSAEVAAPKEADAKTTGKTSPQTPEESPPAGPSFVMTKRVMAALQIPGQPAIPSQNVERTNGRTVAQDEPERRPEISPGNVTGAWPMVKATQQMPLDPKRGDLSPPWERTKDGHTASPPSSDARARPGLKYEKQPVVKGQDPREHLDKADETQPELSPTLKAMKHIKR